MFYLGLVLFFGAHAFGAFFRGPRETLIAKLGAGGFKTLFSAVSLVGFLLIIVGWRSADQTIIYATPFWMRHITYALMLVALILLVAAYAPAGRIAAAAKHPMLAGVKVWAFSHLLVNGDMRSILLFGTFLVFAVADRIALKRRAEPTRDAGPLKNDLIVVVVATAAYAAIAFHLHRYIAGVALL